MITTDHGPRTTNHPAEPVHPGQPCCPGCGAGMVFRMVDGLTGIIVGYWACLTCPSTGEKGRKP